MRPTRLSFFCFFLFDPLSRELRQVLAGTSPYSCSYSLLAHRVHLNGHLEQLAEVTPLITSQLYRLLAKSFPTSSSEECSSPDASCSNGPIGVLFCVKYVFFCVLVRRQEQSSFSLRRVCDAYSWLASTAFPSLTPRSKELLARESPGQLPSFSTWRVSGLARRSSAHTLSCLSWL